MVEATVLEPIILSGSDDQIVHSPLTIAEAVWLGTALLHDKYSNNKNAAFTVDEIVASVVEHELSDAPRETIRQHVKQHCVANLPPRPNRSRMLYMTSDSHRRLFRDGDRSDEQRKGAPTHPDWAKLPLRVREWYETRWNSPAALIANDPLLNAIGTGREVWKGIDPDAYVNELRDGWGDRE